MGNIEKNLTNHAELRRLVWRCRRGLLELDLMLKNFVSTHFYQMNSSELAIFDALLEWPDNDFLDLLNHPERIKDATLLNVITKIKVNKAQ